MSKLLFYNVYGIESSFVASRNEYRLYFYDTSAKNSGIAIGVQFLQGDTYLNIYAKITSSDVWATHAYIKLTNV